MDLDQYTTPEKTSLAPKKHHNSEAETTAPYPVSRFGALLASAILRLPIEKDYSPLHERYPSQPVTL